MKIVGDHQTFPEVKLIQCSRFPDNRGSFEVLCDTKALGISPILQSNMSVSKQYVFRGMHFQLPPFEQAKLVLPIKGGIIDFFLDLRPDSPKKGIVGHTILLNPGEAVYIPHGFAHGFFALNDDTKVIYFTDNVYNKDKEVGINPKAMEDLLGDNEKIDMDKAIISDKDSHGLRIEDALAIYKAHL